MRWISLFSLLLLALLAGCSSEPPAAGKDVLVYGRGGDAQTLDPIHTDIGESVKVMVNLYDTLVTYDDQTTDLVPAIAKEWSHSEDGLTWTFKLRDDVLFHDGTKLDAEAVVFSFERLLQDEHPHSYFANKPYLQSFTSIQSVTAKDPTTVVFELKHPNAIFLQNLAMFPASIVSPTAVKKYGKTFGDHPVGSGPFKFASWQRDQTVKLAAFEDHFRGPPGVEQLIFLRVADNSTRAQQLRRGESHIADDLSPADLEALATTPGMRVQEAQSLNVCYLSMQTQKGALQHVEVRRAIAHAIDKQKLIEIVYGGHADPAVNMCPPAMAGHNADIVDRAFDPAKAKAMLAAVAKEKDLKLPLKLTLATLTDPRPYLPQPKLAASFIKDSLAEIGIIVETQPRNVNQHFDYVMAGKHELALAGWQTDNNDVDNFLYQLLHSKNISEGDQFGNNISFYRNDEVDRLLSAGQTELDQAKRVEIYHQAQQLIFDDAPTVPLAHGRLRCAQSDKVQGYVLHPTGLIRLRLAHFGGAK